MCNVYSAEGWESTEGWSFGSRGTESCDGGEGQGGRGGGQRGVWRCLWRKGIILLSGSRNGNTLRLEKGNLQAEMGTH